MLPFIIETKITFTLWLLKTKIAMPHICNCLDELCRRHVNFVNRCMSHHCHVINFISLHGCCCCILPLLLHARLAAGQLLFGNQAVTVEDLNVKLFSPPPITWFISLYLQQQIVRFWFRFWTATAQKGSTHNISLNALQPARIIFLTSLYIYIS